MPRGAEYAEGTPASDNAIDAGENKIAGAPKEDKVSLLTLRLVCGLRS